MVKEKVTKPNGAFLSDMDEEDYNKYIHETEKGWGKFYKKVFKLK